MDADSKDYDRIARDGLRAAKIPPHMDYWRDELHGAALAAVAEVASKQPDAPRPYLVMAARNAAVDELRRELRREGCIVSAKGKVKRRVARRVNLDPYKLADRVVENTEADPPEGIATAELLERLEAGVDSLPPDLQRVIVQAFGLRGFPPLSHRRLADKLGMSRERLEELISAGLSSLASKVSADQRAARPRNHLDGMVAGLASEPTAHPRPGTPTGTSA